MTDPKHVEEAPASFEESIRRLGEIVQRLEAGDLSLEESLRAFEKGVALARAAKQRLDAAEARVEELLTVDAEGRATTRTIDAKPTTAESSSARAKSNPAPSAKPVGDDDDLPL